MQKYIRIFLSLLTLTLLVGALSFKDQTYKVVTEIEISNIGENRVDCLYPLNVIPIIPNFDDSHIEFRFSSQKREVIGFYIVDIFSWSDIPPPQFA